MTARCKYCEKEFDTEFGLSQHQRQIHPDELPWHDPEWLREKYITKRLSPTEIGELCGRDRQTIKYALHRFDIPMRSISESKRLQQLKEPAHFRSDNHGYERWATEISGKHYSVAVHRLQVIAELGAEAVKGKVVHHKNGIPWDNRSENLKVIPPGEHTSLHHKMGDYEKRNERMRKDGE